MEEVAHLIIRVSSDQVGKAQEELRRLGYRAQETEKASAGFSMSWGKIGAVVAGVTAVIATASAGISKLLDTAKRFESLEAQLKTATGSAENATIAFEAIQDFATQTPYDLAQATDAFIKLVNLGLTPSERALRSYGDTASAMGKDLSDMVLAVSNATVGQFMNLKQFGIKAETTAKGISFTFRGVTTEVKNNAADIEAYFIKLGETNFSGAMTERMATLEGKLSNLGDAWDLLFATISKAGAGDLMKEGIDLAITAVTELTDMLASGQLAGYVEAILFKFESLADGVHNAIANVTWVLETAFDYWGTDGKGAVDFIIDAFVNMPENIRAVVQGIGATLGMLVEYGIAVGKGVYNSVTGAFVLIWESAKNLGKELADQIMHPFSDGSFDYVAKQKAALSNFGVDVKQSWNEAGKSIDNATSAWEGVVTEIMDERDVSIAAFKDKINAADKLREAYDKVKEARKKSGEGKDRLEPFKVKEKSASPDFLKLQDSLKSEEALVMESYNRRLDLIRNNTAEGSAVRIELEKALNDRLAVELDSAENATAERLQSQYEARQNALQLSLDNREISEKDFMEKSKQNWTNYMSGIGSITTSGQARVTMKQLEMHSQVLGMASGIADQMSTLVQGNNDAAKTMFIVSKAIAIAQAIVNTELAATKALAEGGMYAGIPMSTLIRATGYASVALMAATAVQQFGGQFAEGGMIPAGKYGITQEAGFEITHGPTAVSSARATADRLGGMQPSTETKTTVIVNNYTDGQVSVNEREGSDGKIIELTVQRAVKQVAADIRQGGTPVARAMEQTYRLNRGAA